MVIIGIKHLLSTNTESYTVQNTELDPFLARQQ